MLYSGLREDDGLKVLTWSIPVLFTFTKFLRSISSRDVFGNRRGNTNHLCIDGKDEEECCK